MRWGQGEHAPDPGGDIDLLEGDEGRENLD